MTWELIWPYLLAVLIIESTPGPNMGFLAIIGATEGRKYGWATVAGIAVGLAINGLLAAMGLAAVISASPVLWNILRFAGVGYLLYLAWEGWREAGQSSTSRTAHPEEMRDYFRHGLIVNLLNPKAALFYITVLPTFISETAPALPQALALTAISVTVATAIHAGIVLLASTLRPFFTEPERSLIFRRVMALALAAIAIWFGWKTQL